MRFLYSLILYLAVPYLLWHLWWRGRRNPAYRRGWADRFGYVPDLPRGASRIWIHAVSVGEVEASVPLIRRLRIERPDLTILLTTTTPTGADRARMALGDEIQQLHIPYDLPGAARRFVARVKPALAVLVETELWPNLIHSCRRRDVPVVVVNGRLSERSARRYRRVASLIRTMLARVSAVAAQSDADARRFVDLGVPAPRIRTTGNLKFDLVLSDELADETATLRRQWGEGRPVWVAASTHPGEDELVLDAHRAVLRRHSTAVLVVVPRHPERSAEVAALAGAGGLTACLLSDCASGCAGHQVVVGDGMGQLPVLYAASDVAFVGGSLVPRGGHNLLEPAVLGVPVLTGTHMFNFAEINRLLLTRGAAWSVSDTPGLSEAVTRLLADSAARREMGDKGRRAVAENRGAVDKVMEVLGPYIPGARKDGEREQKKG